MGHRGAIFLSGQLTHGLGIPITLNIELTWWKEIFPGIGVLSTVYCA